MAEVLLLVCPAWAQMIPLRCAHLMHSLLTKPLFGYNMDATTHGILRQHVEEPCQMTRQKELEK